jgi:thiamine transport system substrate-binding protein
MQSNVLNLVRAALAALLAAAGFAAEAAEKPTLTVYTYSSFSGEYGPGGLVKQRFEAVCGCVLKYVESEDAGTLLARLKLEGASSRADVVLGLDTNLMGEAEKTGFFAPSGVDLSGLSLPVPWTDQTFVPFDWGWFAFVYDSTKLKTPPASLHDLVEAKDGPKIVIEDPRTSSPGLGLLLWIKEVYGDKAGDAWRQLAPKIVTVTQGWSEAYDLFLKGEADMVLSYTTSPAYHIAEEKKTKYRADAFPEGNYLQVEVAGMTKAAKNPDLARSFLRFVLTEPFQSAMPEGNWMYPAKMSGALPASYQSLAKPAKSLLAPPDEVAANRRAWVDEWLAATSR